MRITALLFLCSCVLGLKAQTFSDVATNVNVIGSFGEAGFFGGAISFIDFNGDGWDDLSFSTQSGEDVYFFENQNGSFTQLNGLINHTGISQQILWVDYDNDGDKDLFIADRGGQNKFYRNDGNLQMTDITNTSGLQLINDQSVCANFCDVNMDGYLDLYIGNYEYSNTNYLYLNDTNGGFIDYTNASGISDGTRLSLATVFFDYDDDGDPDLFVANDKSDPNSFYENNGSGIFTDVSVATGISMVFDAMNAGIGDCDMDGLLDIYVTNGPVGNVLYRNNGDQTFTNIAGAAGVLMNKLCWGGNFFDFDLDTDEDLYVCAGNWPSNQANLLYVNNGVGLFNPLVPGGFPGDDKASFSNAIGDFNNDGKPDIAVSNDTNEPFQLWQNNVSVGSNRWAKLKLVGTNSNKDGIGSKLDIRIQGNQFLKQTYCGLAFMAQNADYVMMGTGTALRIDSVFIEWPSGTVDLFVKLRTNQMTTLVEGSSGYSPPLPLFLNQFEAKSNSKSIQLEWDVYSTLGVEKHILQRSLDGSAFRSIYELDIEDPRHEKFTASYIDFDVIVNRKYFYRLAAVDITGEIEYSPIVNAKVHDIVDGISKPRQNPVSNTLQIEIYEQSDAIKRVKILDLNGIVLSSRSISENETNEIINIPLDDLPAGIYYYNLEGLYVKEVKPFIKI